MIRVARYAPSGINRQPVRWLVVSGKEAVRACATAIGDVQGKSATTIEGLAQGNRLHPIQDAFVKHAAFQCGYCTPGMIMGAYALLLKKPNATWADISRNWKTMPAAAARTCASCRPCRRRRR